MTLQRFCTVGSQLHRLKLVRTYNSTSAILRYCSSKSTTSDDDKLRALPQGLQKLAKIKVEDWHHINPGPPTTHDDIPIPFKKFEEAKKDFMPTFNLYFYGSLILFAVTFYWVFFIEDIWPYNARAPVKSYRERHKHKKLPESPNDDSSGGGKTLAGAAVAGAALAIDSSEKEVIKANAGTEEDVKVDISADSSISSIKGKKAVVNEDSIVPEETSPVRPEKGTVVDSKKLPEEIPYLLIGSGAASYYAALAIRARDPDAKVLMIGDEKHLPYNRPPLSKELWWYGEDQVAETLEYRGYSGKKRDVYFEAPGFFILPGEIESAEHGGVSLVSGHRVVKLDLTTQTAYLDDGRSLKYQKCLIATGGYPKSLPAIENASEEVKRRVMFFRTIDDFRKLDEIVRKSKSITIIGGSFLGSELANSLNRRFGEQGLQICQIFREKGNVAEILPQFLSKYITSELRKSGINVMPEKELKRVTIDESGKLRLQLATGETISTDHIIMAVGICANTDLAKSCGLEIDPMNGGYVVDAELRARSNVWVAGDASSFYDVKLGRRRMEHWEHAQITGRLAGENMTGANRAYWHQSSYYSILAPSVHLEAVGRTDSGLKTVSVLADTKADEVEKGVVFYLDGKVIVGVLLLNVSGPGIEVARRLIADGREHDSFKELAKLFNLHKSKADDEQEG
ncbi:Pyridine nucleotide-disulphide oxidoreductase family protein [Brugia malayi]|uniref:BMA-WAH-1 n=2 Tax=Brugia TaxID=6278 RepID=A0A0K0JQ16_BRUMA|nr:Pyridine nucleotide-disulfide oxidoreductase family protein [Brugia malayi]CDQ00259.2 BMA-WAH-1 [Brugia malayi]VIO90949.1 Pyridine nucleotide-disulphide oxidoreductase family protein [Brugia malayi]